MAEQVPEQVKDQRLAGLLQLLAAQQAAFNRQSQGTVQEVLLVESGKQAGQCKGRSPWMQSVVVDLPEVWLGQMAFEDCACSSTQFGRGASGSPRRKPHPRPSHKLYYKPCRKPCRSYRSMSPRPAPSNFQSALC